MPRVSVIIPSYNRASVLPRAIESIVTQSYTDWEIILIDDGSTDNTRQVVEGYALQGVVIRYFWQENKKQAAARNLGIRNARGEYIAFLDSDDTWLPNKLERQVAILDQDSEVGMVSGNQLMFTGENDSGKLRYPPGWLRSGKIFNDLIKRRFYCSTQTVLVRRSVLDEVGGFDEQFANALEDWELTLRIAWRYSVSCIDEAVVTRYVNHRHTRDYAVIRARNHREILKKTFALYTVPLEEQNLVWKGAWISSGVSLMEAGYYLRSIECSAQALRLGHRFSVPMIVLALMGPLGRYIFSGIRKGF